MGMSFPSPPVFVRGYISLLNTFRLPILFLNRQITLHVLKKMLHIKEVYMQAVKSTVQDRMERKHGTVPRLLIPIKLDSRHLDNPDLKPLLKCKPL